MLPPLVALGLMAAGVLGRVTTFLGLVSRVPFPHVAGASLLWWIVIPLGAAVAAGLLGSRLSDVRSRVLLGALVGVLLSSLVNVRWYERYVDFPILLALAALALVAGVVLGRFDRERWLLAGIIAVASFVWFL